MITKSCFIDIQLDFRDTEAIHPMRRRIRSRKGSPSISHFGFYNEKSSSTVVRARICIRIMNSIIKPTSFIIAHSQDIDDTTPGIVRCQTFPNVLSSISHLPLLLIASTIRPIASLHRTLSNSLSTLSLLLSNLSKMHFCSSTLRSRVST